MDVQSNNSRERVFSILNDNDCPSFVVRTKESSPSTTLRPKLPSISSLTSFSSRLERPNLARLPQFQRNRSISSAGSPPLLRYDSLSSTESPSSMDSTPSPTTPAYNYNDASLVPFDSLLRPDATLNYLPSPTGITPFVEQGMMIGVLPQEPLGHKHPQPLAPAVYPPMPAAVEMNQIPTPALSADASVSSSSSASQPVRPVTANNNAVSAGKKNKYPCPYAQSHHCSATFTTSGHAARHGKKHTGEKGVHCPVCDKAFTRKDNMKQHERTHKNRPANGEEKKSKAQTTRDANKSKDIPKEEVPVPALPVVLQNPAQIRKSSSGLSDPSDITLPLNPIDTPVDTSPSFFADPTPQIVLPTDTALDADSLVNSMYPPPIDEPLAATAMSINEKLEMPVPQPPTLVRGFSDLDTLAQAAESQYDPYYQQPQF